MGGFAGSGPALSIACCADPDPTTRSRNSSSMAEFCPNDVPSTGHGPTPLTGATWLVCGSCHEHEHARHLALELNVAARRRGLNRALTTGQRRNPAPLSSRPRRGLPATEGTIYDLWGINNRPYIQGVQKKTAPLT